MDTSRNGPRADCSSDGKHAAARHAASALAARHEGHRIILIEDSMAVASLLGTLLHEATGAMVVHCSTLAAAKLRLAEGGFVFAITGLSLDDASGEDILQCLDGFGVPAIVFTAKHNPHAQARYVELSLLDYFVKDETASVERVVRAAARILDNALTKVLVVDDMQSARLGLVDILVRQNFKVIEARSGAEALELLDSHNDVELLITDYNMPDMNGYELVDKVRQTRLSNELRIIGVSSSTDRRLSSLFLKAGASDFMYRPLLAEEFQCRIDSNVETLKQIKRLRYYAERDPLTSMPNRRYFFESASRLMAEDRLHGVRSAVALLDIDHFKKINDTHGHEAGDETLRTIAACLQATVDKTQHMMGRIGGEEFALYLRGLSQQAAHAFCEDLRRAVEQARIELRNSRMISVTASIGVADVQAHEPLDNQLNAADQLLYMAKKSGRNRVFSELSLAG